MKDPDQPVLPELFDISESWAELAGVCSRRRRGAGVEQAMLEPLAVGRLKSAAW